MQDFVIQPYRHTKYTRLSSSNTLVRGKWKEKRLYT